MPPSAHPTKRLPVNVAVADPHPLYRDALSRTVKTHPSLTLSGSAETPATLATDPTPDVLVVDAGLLDAGAAALDAGVWEPAPLLLVVAEQVDGAELFAALEVGARGYLSKQATGEVLCRAILGVARGDTVLDPDAQAAMAGEVRIRTRDDRPTLSPREHEILRHIAEGETAPQIARTLHLSTATVKTHILHLYAKLGVTERAAAVAVAMRSGVIE